MQTTSSQILISADSHVSEAGDLWATRLPARFRDDAPQFPNRGDRGGTGRFEEKTGGWDPGERLKEMATDGVSAEVLYPTLGLRLFGLDDPALQEACFRVYNDWIIDYCSAAPDRLIGLGMLSMYNVEHAVRELERCREAGLRGAIIWQVPPPEIPFTSDHYEPFWAAAQEMSMPINLHILSGHGYNKRRALNPTPANRAMEQERSSVNEKLIQAMDALYDLIFSGVLERFPRLRVVMVENEIGWIPFLLDRMDHVTCAVGANIFLVMEDRHLKVLTPLLQGRDVQVALLGLWCRPPLALIYDPHRLTRGYFTTCFGRIKQAVEGLQRALQLRPPA